MTKTYSLTEKIWLYPGKAGWFFITIPEEVSKEIDYFFANQKKGWCSLPVTVTIGQTTWQTSIFPDKKSAAYLLPIKIEVRKKENIRENDAVSLTLKLSS